MWIRLAKLTVACLFLLALVSRGVPAWAQQALVETSPQQFGDWQLDCEPSGDCRLSQSVLITDTQEPILVLRVYHAGGGEDLAIASLPLGVFLPAGIGLVIDAQPEQRFVYETCNQSGCHVGIPLDSALLAGLKVGATALVRVFDGGQQPVDLPLSLSGFAQGHAALVGRAPQAMRFGDQTPGAAAPKAGDLSLWPHT